MSIQYIQVESKQSKWNNWTEQWMKRKLSWTDWKWFRYLAVFTDVNNHINEDMFGRLTYVHMHISFESISLEKYGGAFGLLTVSWSKNDQ